MLSRNMGNLFENFVWVLVKYYEHVFFFGIFGLFINSMLVV